MRMDKEEFEREWNEKGLDCGIRKVYVRGRGFLMTNKYDFPDEEHINFRFRNDECVVHVLLGTYELKDVCDIKRYGE
jgi:hypothetical protein